MEKMSEFLFTKKKEIVFIRTQRPHRALFSRATM